MPWNDSIVVAVFILCSTDWRLTLYFTISWGWSSPCHAEDQSSWCNQSGRQYKVFIAIIQSNNYLLSFCLSTSVLGTVGKKCIDGRILSLSSWITYLGKEAGHVPLNETALRQTKPGSQGLAGTWGWGKLCVCMLHRVSLANVSLENHKVLASQRRKWLYFMCPFCGDFDQLPCRSSPDERGHLY